MLQAIGKWIRRLNGWISVDDIDPTLDLEWRLKWREIEEPTTFQGTVRGVAEAVTAIKTEFGELPEHLTVRLPDGNVARIW